MASIPSVNLDSCQASEISDAIASLGFLSVQSPDVPSADHVQRMFEISSNFFVNESPEEKAKAGITVGNVGWVKVRQEKLDAQGHPSGDIKEAFNMRPFNADDKAQQPLPPLLSAQEKEIASFARACHHLCMRLLEAFALFLDQPKDFFTSRHSYDQPQGTILRLLYYPPTELRESAPAVSDIRAGAHSDYGSLTLLFQKDIGGLQILLPSRSPTSDPAWLNAPVVKDAVLVNVGDLMEFWTGGQLKSTVHRVALPTSPEEAGARFSIAYFLHPDDNILVDRLTPQGEGEEARKAAIAKAQAKFGVDPNGPPLTAGEWLQRRLAASYTGRKDRDA